ncbi:hypothetical protein HYV31_02670 [candidate division WWE3 bacterium]|nr:hypothetical protein [candidate division WWE3 bacterium]
MSGNMVKIFGKILVSVIYLFALYFFTCHILAELAYNTSQSYTTKIKLTEALNYANKSLNYNSHEPKYFYNKAKILLLLETPKVETLNNLVIAQNLNPKNVVTLRNSLPLYYFLTLKNLQDAGSKTENFDKWYFEKTKTFISSLKKAYPNDAGIIVLAAKYEKKLGLTKEYGESINAVGILRPDLLKWHPDLIGTK